MGVGSMVALAVERIVAPVEGMHRAIAAPWFRALGAVGRPVQIAHDAISRVVYGSIRLGSTAVGIGLDARAAPGSQHADPARAFVNGLWGDALGRHEHRVDTPMTLLDRRGDPLPPGPELSAAIPTATGRLVVLVHGLMQTERSWFGTESRPGLADALEDHGALTPIAVRYNTGLAVRANGERLAALLEDLRTAWPHPVESVALVGHSMGGLVVRSACAAAVRAGHGWIEEVSDVVAIGSPHRGAPLEKLVTAAAWGLRVAPQTRPLADFLDTRSRGIQDLRTGSISDPPDGTATDELAHVRYHFVAGVITSDPAHPIGAVVGDLMVRPASSTRAPSLEPADVVVLGGVNHFDLLHEPAVIDQVMARLAPPR